jgi:type II secretion system protein G
MHRRGFTLVELLVVISIIGILIGIIIPNLGAARQSSRDAKRISDIKNIQLAIALYYSDNNKYPTDHRALAPIYLGTVPKDPQTNSDYLYQAMHRGGGSTNCILNTPIAYHLGAVMEIPDASGSANRWQDRDLNATTDQTAPNPDGTCTGGTAGSTKFDGNATGCSGPTAVTNDPCYDVVSTN